MLSNYKANRAQQQQHAAGLIMQRDMNSPGGHIKVLAANQRSAGVRRPSTHRQGSRPNVIKEEVQENKHKESLHFRFRAA